MREIRDYGTVWTDKRGEFASQRHATMNEAKKHLASLIAAGMRDARIVSSTYTRGPTNARFRLKGN